MAIPPQVGGALVTGGATLLGNVISSAFGAHQAQKQMDFQDKMSSTSHQREVEDLRKAGLNPILSARLGGASTPPGAMAPTPDFGSSARSALEALQVQSQLKLQDSQARNLDVQSLDTVQTNRARIDLMLAQYHQALEAGNVSVEMKKRITAEVENLLIEKKILQSESTSSALDLDRARRESEFFKSKAGKVAPFMRFNPLGQTLPNIFRRK